MELPFSAAEGRRLLKPIVTHLHGFGAVVRQIGVYPKGDGLLFVADVNGRVVSMETRPGPLAYHTVAEGLLTATLQPEPIAVKE